VALVVAYQWMPETTGLEFLAQARRVHPQAARTLLIEYGDRRCAEAIIRGMALGHLDNYLTKPWRPREHLLYPVVGEVLGDWARRNLPHFELVKVVGRQWDASHSYGHLVHECLRTTPVNGSSKPPSTETPTLRRGASLSDSACFRLRRSDAAAAQPRR
jgi:CheY-like chemotaxis protein